MAIQLDLFPDAPSTIDAPIIESITCVMPDTLTMRIINLVLRYKSYDMIVYGGKRDVYKRIRQYWCKRLRPQECKYRLPETSINYAVCTRGGALCPCCHQRIAKIFTHVRLRRGYTSKNMLWSIKSLDIGHGKMVWGAPQEDVLILTLGEKVR